MNHYVTDEFNQHNFVLVKKKDKRTTGDNTVNVIITTNLKDTIDKIKATLTGPDKDFLIRRLP